MKRKTVYYVCKGKKKIGKPYDTLDEAEGFMNFLIMVKPFEFGYNICERKKWVRE